MLEWLSLVRILPKQTSGVNTFSNQIRFVGTHSALVELERTTLKMQFEDPTPFQGSADMLQPELRL